MVERGNILLICDDERTAQDLSGYLGFEGKNSVSVALSGQGGLDTFRRNSFDLVIAELGTFDLAGIELIKDLKKIDPECVILTLLNDNKQDPPQELYALGVYEIIHRPLNLDRLRFIIKKGIELHYLIVANRKFTQGLKEHNVSLEKQNVFLARRIEESTKNLSRLYEDLRSTYLRTIKTLAQAIDARDHYTHSHSENVERFAVSIAEEMGLSARDIEIIREACQLHDLGKIGVEDNILSKPASLTELEWVQIKRHPAIAAQILEPLTFLSEVIELVRQHHEHYDGSGYPEGRRAEDILLGARIIHLGDAYDAMRSARSYRKIPLSKEEAIAEIKRNSGTQFDPKVVEAFLRIVDRL
jgi:putative nucleotidyltransferase with HDIG domain